MNHRTLGSSSSSPPPRAQRLGLRQPAAAFQRPARWPSPAHNLSLTNNLILLLVLLLLLERPRKPPKVGSSLSPPTRNNYTSFAFSTRSIFPPIT